MKKTYNQPACLVVELSITTNMMIQGSLIIDKSGTNTITDKSQILTKESVSDVNLWDEEW
jgi:hypothetical protein